MITLTETSCLTFKYYTLTSSIDGTKGVVLIRTSEGGLDEEMLWSMHGVSYWNWWPGQVELEMGTFQLTFQIMGADILGGFDDIEVTPGPCGEFG